MEIRVQSIRFDADQKLLDFIDKKLGKLSKYYDAVIGAEVRLSLLQEHDNKNVWVRVQVPGNDIVVERNAAKFEDAIVDCADILKEKLTRVKEKQIRDMAKAFEELDKVCSQIVSDTEAKKFAPVYLLMCAEDYYVDLF